MVLKLVTDDLYTYSDDPPDQDYIQGDQLNMAVFSGTLYIGTCPVYTFRVTYT